MAGLANKSAEKNKNIPNINVSSAVAIMITIGTNITPTIITKTTK